MRRDAKENGSDDFFIFFFYEVTVQRRVVVVRTVTIRARAWRLTIVTCVHGGVYYASGSF